jgi:hypothetical protein
MLAEEYTKLPFKHTCGGHEDRDGELYNRKYKKAEGTLV